MVLAVACSVGQSGESRRPAASAVRSAAPSLPPQVTQLATWQRCGATQVPPADVLKIPTQLPKVINRTNGAVSDADAQKWVAAYTREQGIELWALTHGEEGLFRGGCLSSRTSTLQVFAQELKYLEVARASSRKIDVRSATYVSVATVPVSTDVQMKIRGLDGIPSDFALVVEIQGPGGADYVDGTGNRSPAAVIKATDHFWTHLTGSYSEVAIGPIWYIGSDWSCTTTWLRATCGV
jgi:hypothetical protein